MDRKEARKMDRFTHYAVAAALMAVKDANLTINEENADRVGVWIGSGIGGMETFEKQFEMFLKRGYRRVSPFFVPMMIPDMASWTSFDFFRSKRVQFLYSYSLCNRNELDWRCF